MSSRQEPADAPETALPEAVHQIGEGHKVRFYVPALDGIRAVAFMMVFLGHAGVPGLPAGLGVTVFFFLSGYLITTLLRMEYGRNQDISLTGFYFRRSRRILPPMYLTVLLAWVLAWIGWLDRMPLSNLPAIFLYYANYFALITHRDIASGLGLLWSLSVEEHFYLVFPLVFLWLSRGRMSRRAQARVLLAACVAALVWRCVLVFVMHVPISYDSLQASRWTYTATDCRFDGILLGCVLAMVQNPVFADVRPTASLERWTGAWGLAGAVLLVAASLPRDVIYRSTFRYSLQAVALYLIFYFCVRSKEHWVVKLLSLQPVRYLGHVSYSMYLCHSMFLQIAGERFSGFATGVIAFVSALIYGALMRALVEVPIRNVGAHIGEAKHA